MKSPPSIAIRSSELPDAALLARLIALSHRDVAQRFGLTAENCPKHPSMCTEEWLRNDFSRGERYFVLELGHEPVACVATENPNAEVAYLNRLSVLPAYRRQGIGERLVRHVVEDARARSAKTLSIGIIAEYVELERWYAKLGFVPGETRRFPHLPFTVRYMAYALDSVEREPS